jgi:hypothetical protein
MEILLKQLLQPYIQNKMDKQSLRKRVDTLNNMNQLKKAERLSFLKNCPDECIHALCEVCFNLLHQTIKLGKDKKYRLKQKLKPIRVDLRKLADSKLSVKSKRRILRKPQVGNGILGILATTILPALISALTSK